MDFLSLLLRGAALGLSIAAPVGPIGVLCIRRTLTEGRIYGLVSGLGAASADALYGMIAAFGLAVASNALVSLSVPLRLGGGLFLIYLGYKTLRAQPAERAAIAKDSEEGPKNRLRYAYLSTLALTLTNPTTILSFLAMFAGIGVGSATVGSDGDLVHYLSAGLIVLGVFSGSALWWFILSAGTSLLRDRLDTRALVWVNRVSGVVIVTFGLLALYSLRG